MCTAYAQHMQAGTYCMYMVLNRDVSHPFIATYRVIEMIARGTDNQAGYVDHFVIAVSPFNIRTFTAQPLKYTAYTSP